MVISSRIGRGLLERKLTTNWSSCMKIGFSAAGVDSGGGVSGIFGLGLAFSSAGASRPRATRRPKSGTRPISAAPSPAPISSTTGNNTKISSFFIAGRPRPAPPAA